ncbi:MAG: hypothetical protein IPM92_14940 [Saprospiraceae bacterium]|nr:hypothetical protein [Saprospiraceae bacterium]
MKTYFYIFLLNLLCLGLHVNAQEETIKNPLIEIKGYIKDIQTSFFQDRIESITSFNTLHNRINLKLNLDSKLYFKLELRNRILWGDLIKEIPNYGTFLDDDAGFINLSKLWMDEKGFVIHSMADRMYLHYTTDVWDIKLGRQRINWGINTIWNPNDIFNAYNFLDFDYEERPGSDALRIQKNLRSNASIEFAYKPGKNKDQHIGGILYKWNSAAYDFQLLTGLLNTDYFIGGGWAGSIMDAGFKGEFSYFHPKKNTDDTSGVWSLSFMFDQTFTNEWYLSFAYLYNSQPNGSLIGNSGFLDAQLSAKSLFPYRTTFYTGISKSLSPIHNLALALIYSPTQNTILCIPSYHWNAATNFDIDITLQSSFAEISKTYKSIGNAFYIRGKWSF